MASSSTVPSVLDMVELHANGLGIPILFPVDANGFASVSSLHLSIKFLSQNSTIWVKSEIYYTATSLLSLIMRENPRLADNGSPLWELGARKYGVYGPLNSSTNVSTDIRTPPHSSASTLNIPPVVKGKIEPSIHTVINLSDSSDGDEPLLSIPIPKQSPSSLRSTFDTPPHLCHLPPSPARPHMSILQCLRTLVSMPGMKNILKKIDYDTLQIMDVNFLPPRFDGNQMFVPPIGISSFHTKAKSMDGMDKRYDGHVWTKTQTTNITNGLGLAFCSSSCVGHLECHNPACDYLQRVHRTSTVNDTDFFYSQNSPLPLVGPYLWGPLIFVKSVRSQLHCPMPCLNLLCPLNVPAFI